MIPPRLPPKVESETDTFLCRIYAIPQDTPLDKVNSIIQQLSKTGFFTSFFNRSKTPQTYITDALKTLKVEIKTAGSVSDYDLEIQGAFNGLYLLLNHATNEKEKVNIKDMIADFKEFLHKAKFQSNTTEELIKRINVLDPALEKKIKQDPKLKEMVDQFRVLFGQHRAFTDTKFSPAEKSLLELLSMTLKIASENKHFANAVSTYLTAAQQVKSENRELLRKGVIPNPNNPSKQATTGLLANIYSLLLSDYDDRLGLDVITAIKNLFNDINERSLLTNTQAMSDTMRMAVHQIPDTTHEGWRTWNSKNKAARSDGYFPAQSTYFLQNVDWKVIPVKETNGEKWQRMIGFKTLEGKTLEAKVSLELGFLGPLSDDMQRRIENFLRDYEKIAQKTSEWYEHKALPPEKSEQLIAYVQQHFPELSTERRSQLIEEVGRFIYHANYIFADNLLNFA